MHLAKGKGFETCDGVCKMLFLIYERKGFLYICCIFRQTYFFFTEFVPFPFVLNVRMCYSETHGIPRNEHFSMEFETHFKSIPRNFFGTKFRWQP